MNSQYADQQGLEAGDTPTPVRSRRRLRNRQSKVKEAIVNDANLPTNNTNLPSKIRSKNTATKQHQPQQRPRRNPHHQDNITEKDEGMGGGSDDGKGITSSIAEEVGVDDADGDGDGNGNGDGDGHSDGNGHSDGDESGDGDDNGCESGNKGGDHAGSEEVVGNGIGEVPHTSGGANKKQEALSRDAQPREMDPQMFPSQLFCVRVHKSEPLRPDVNISHPVVCVHVVDRNTGEYAKKSDIERPVVTHFEYITTGERKSQWCDFVLPIMTQPFALRGPSLPLTYTPSWEEDLLWNEPPTHVVTSDTLLLFEIMDFGPRLPTTHLVDGWMPIAWAFLIPQPNIAMQRGKPLRLQLFSYPPLEGYRKTLSVTPRIPRIFTVWVSRSRTRYPATLYVSISTPLPPLQSAPTLRTFTPLDSQLLTRPWAQSTAGVGSSIIVGATPADPTGESKNQTKTDIQLTGVRGSLSVRRERGQSCLVPDTLLYRLDSGSRGCFGLQFSHSGQFLVGLCADAAMFPIKLYDIYTGKCVHTFAGHHDMIYDIVWAEQDDALLTASSDGTAKIWPLPKEDATTTSLMAFQHTCFVYCAQFHPTATEPRQVVTGAYDSMIRVWDRDSGKVLHEIAGHKSHVNTLVFEKSGERLFSGDGVGMVHVWDAHGALTLLKIISTFHGSPVNTIRIHPLGRRLLVHTRNSSIHSLDSRFFTVDSTFTNIVNVEWPIKATYSICGKYVATGSENGKIVIYEEESRTVLHTYIGASYGLVEPVTSIEWHPSHHILALCAFGPRAPILVFARNLDNEAAAAPSLNTSKTEAAERARRDIADRILATPPASTALSSSGRPTLPPLASMPSSLSHKHVSAISLPPLPPPLSLSDSTFRTPNRSLLPPSASSSVLRSPWMLDGSQFSISSPLLQKSRLDTQLQSPSSEDLRRSQKKFRRKRREATLTQIRKERAVSPLPPQSQPPLDKTNLIEVAPENTPNPNTNNSPSNVNRDIVETATSSEQHHPLGLLESE